jgi:two-component system sensor histidine kinase UhpB
MSLRAQFFLSVILALTVSLSLEAAVACWQAQRSVANEMTMALKAGDHIVDNALLSLPADNIDPYLARLVESFNGNRHIRVSLIEHGRQSAVSHVAPPDPVPGWFLALLEIPVQRRIDVAPRLGPQRMILVTTDAHNEISEVWGQFRAEELILSLFSLLMLGLLSVVMARMAASLKKLRAGFDAVGGGDYAARVRPRGPRELSHLAHAFNRMAERLEGIESANRRMGRQLLAIQDEERAELARELHDEMGPFLFAVRVDGEGIEAAARKAGLPAVVERARAIGEAVTHIQRHVRLLLKQLRPADFADFGLATAIENLAGFWRRHNERLDIVLDIAAARDGFGADIDAAIYRLVQEGLTNAARHSSAARIWITVIADGQTVRVCLEDDGVGLAANGLTVDELAAGSLAHGGLGLKGMRERLANLSGTLRLGPRPGGGTRLAADIPRQRAHHGASQSEPA